ncbi:MAG: hypothetical protein U1E15_07355 [Hyphomicrobiales bacterium]
MMGGPLALHHAPAGCGRQALIRPRRRAPLFGLAREKAGDALVRAAAANIPGLSGYL